MKFFTFLSLLLILIPKISFASVLNSGDTAWILTSTALVLFMTLPGLALFYGGLVRSRKCIICPDALHCSCMFNVNLMGNCRLLNCFWRWLSS